MKNSDQYCLDEMMVGVKTGKAAKGNLLWRWIGMWSLHGHMHLLKPIK